MLDIFHIYFMNFDRLLW